MTSIKIIQSRPFPGPFCEKSGMASFILPGTWPGGFLLAWEKKEVWAEPLYEILWNRLSQKACGIREEGLFEEEPARLWTPEGGAVLRISGYSYEFYRKNRFLLYYVQDHTLAPLLPPRRKGDHGADICRGEGRGRGFFFIGAQELQKKPLPEDFWQFRRLGQEAQFHMAEYMGGKGFPAAFFYWK